ncbi:MAG: YihY/virulence factor BrkB family protein [Gracilimonas sp.]|nr:YihY/virulence factor BrkB family protein [Gracilimonas sp.]
MEFIRNIFKVISIAVNGFIDDNCFQYSAAVSFYTLFSLAPIVMITVYIGGLFAGNESVMSELNAFLNDTVGADSTEAVMLLVETIQTDTRNVLYLILSFGFLLISATTVFVQFKDSFNRIFKIVPRKDAGFLKMLFDRAVSFGMILFLGVAMIFSLILDTVLIGLFDLLSENYESTRIVLASFGGNALTFIMIFLAIMTMFYILPDAKARKKPWVVGSLVTAILLVLGKFGVGMIIGNSSLNELNGASSSVIILMLWVYYSSIIVFFGAELVKAMVEHGGSEIKAGRFARKMRMVEIESQKKES